MSRATPIELKSDVQKEKIFELQRQAFGDFAEHLYDHILRHVHRGMVGYGSHNKDRRVAAFT